jgi:hypothetical protein
MESKKRKHAGSPVLRGRNVRRVFLPEPFESIPDEILCHIFRFVDPVFDAFPIWAACRRWRACFLDIALSPSEWKERKAARSEKGLDERFSDVFLMHHLRRHHTSVLRYYFSERHINGAVLGSQEFHSVLAEAPREVIKWLHYSQNMEIRKRHLLSWMNAANTDVLDWLIDDQPEIVTYKRTFASHHQKTEVAQKVLKMALNTSTKTRNGRLWEWFRCRNEDADVLRDALWKVLERGFATAASDILECVGRQIRWEDVRYAEAMSSAILGNNTEVLNIVVETFEGRGHALCPFQKDIRRCATLALESCCDRSYIWLLERFYRRVKPPTPTQVERIMFKKRRESAFFVSYVLAQWPRLVGTLDARDKNRMTPKKRITSVKRMIIVHFETELLRALNEKGCMLFTKRDLAGTLHWFRTAAEAMGPDDRAGQFIRHIGATLGLSNPDTWRNDQLLDTWK